MWQPAWDQHACQKLFSWLSQSPALKAHDETRLAQVNVGRGGMGYLGWRGRRQVQCNSQSDDPEQFTGRSFSFFFPFTNFKPSASRRNLAAMGPFVARSVWSRRSPQTPESAVQPSPVSSGYWIWIQISKRQCMDVTVWLTHLISRSWSAPAPQGATGKC